MAQSGSPPPFPTTETSSEMRKKQKQEDEQEQQPLGSLPEGPLVDILSRVPYRSLCRFKCVSKPWLALCSDHQVRKRCPQTLTGFFHHRPHGRLGVNFRNLSGRGPPMVDPSLPFLRKSYELVNPEHCCGGLILCRCWKSVHSGGDEYNLLVCNPATEKWTELPPCPVEWTETNEDEQYLGFDPASPSRFVVFLHLFYSAQVTIYSSDTGRWTVLQSNQPFTVSGFSESVFMKGTMHLSTVKGSIVTVDTEGKVWKEIDIPGNVPTRMQCFSIGQSQGHLYAWCIDDPNVFRLSVWVLEDYDRAKWTLKHSVNILELFGRHSCKYDEFYEMFAIHPDRNLIFLTNGKKTISYDMDNREVHDMDIAKTLCRVQHYIPCFADCLSDGH
ncbi:putative F-box protein At1g19160 [Lolium perenne]|uniref:putative F-box protein At1g19160 n=1 Tax=Lolium perenne TaxID=4522 RepID=UPI0021EA5CDC|nr:F-box protein At5g07610-like isoform X1 [Lolium perenne]XP_051230040.1 F-box protein At5g07610-like isoform X2 [Lolium perenne]